MLKKIDHTLLGAAYHTWLQSVFHFSIADYYKPGRKRFGYLTVINDDVIHAGSGHDLHKHRDVEILGYVIEGQLTHAVKGDGPKKLEAGDLYYLSAGSGVMHAEVNWGNNRLRMLQFWFSPKFKNIYPSVHYASPKKEYYQHKWLQIGSEIAGEAIFQINQEVEIFICELEVSKEIIFEVKKERQAYLVQINGESIINDVRLVERDGLEIFEEIIRIKAMSDSLYIIIEMKKE